MRIFFKARTILKSKVSQHESEKTYASYKDALVTRWLEEQGSVLVTRTFYCNECTHNTEDVEQALVHHKEHHPEHFAEHESKKQIEMHIRVKAAGAR